MRTFSKLSANLTRFEHFFLVELHGLYPRGQGRGQAGARRQGRQAGAGGKGRRQRTASPAMTDNFVNRFDCHGGSAGQLLHFANTLAWAMQAKSTSFEYYVH